MQDTIQLSALVLRGFPEGNNGSRRNGEVVKGKERQMQKESQ